MPIESLNPEFFVWLIQYFSPSAAVVVAVSYYTFRSLMVIHNIVKELKNKKKENGNDHDINRP